MEMGHWTQSDDPSERLKVSEGERRLHGESKVGESMDKPDLDRWKSEKGQS